jgi:hypothetical protein
MNLESKTLVQLKDIARSNGLKNWSKLTKKPLIEFLISNGFGGDDEPARARSKSPARPRTPSRGRARPRSKSPARPRTPSRGRARPRPKSPARKTPTTDTVPIVVVKAILNLDRTMDKTEFLKKVQKTQMVRYANELGIKGKSLAKGPLLDRILETSIKDARDEYVSNIPKFLTDIPISIDLRDRVYEILDEIEKYDDEFSTELKDSVLDVAEQLKQRMPRYQTKYTNLTPDVIKTVVFEHVLKDALKTRLEEYLDENILSRSVYESLIDKLAHVDLRKLKDVLKELNDSVAVLAVEEEIVEAESKRVRELVDVIFTRYFVNKTIADYTLDIASELSRIDENLEESLFQTIVDRFENFDNRLAKYQQKYPEAGQQELMRIASNEQIVKAVKYTIAHALKDDVISEAVAEDLLSRLVPVEENTARQVKRQITKQVRKVRPETVDDIESLLREVQKPGKTVAGIATIQQRVFKCLGLTN